MPFRSSNPHCSCLNLGVTVTLIMYTVSVDARWVLLSLARDEKMMKRNCPYDAE